MSEPNEPAKEPRRITRKRLAKIGFVVKRDAGNVPSTWYEHEETGLELWDGGWANGEWIVNQFDQGGLRPEGIYTMRAVRILIWALRKIRADNEPFERKAASQ